MFRKLPKAEPIHFETDSRSIREKHVFELLNPSTNTPAHSEHSKSPQVAAIRDKPSAAIQLQNKNVFDTTADKHIVSTDSC